ncbi:MAG: hypothetical protein WB698_01275 [Solirubrobacteraceae bacterium]
MSEARLGCRWPEEPHSQADLNCRPDWTSFDGIDHPFAATLTGLRPAGRRPSTNADIEALRADGALSGKLCDEMRHAYIYVEADDIHAAVDSTLKLLPGFIGSYVSWLAEYGVDVA